MVDTAIQEPATSSLPLYRELFDQFDLHALTQTQLLDLAALSAEHAEGLCHGLMLLDALLQKTPQTDSPHWKPLNHYLNATAHLVPALYQLYGRALREMDNVPPAN